MKIEMLFIPTMPAESLDEVRVVIDGRPGTLTVELQKAIIETATTLGYQVE